MLVSGFRSAVACITAGLGSAIVSEEVSCTVSSAGFPLVAREEILIAGGGCGDFSDFAGSASDGFGVAAAVELDEAFVELVEAGASAFFCDALLELEFRRDVGVEGGGERTRGDGGTCCRGSTDGSFRRGSFEVISGELWLCTNCGIFEADKARCIDAADGGPWKAEAFAIAVFVARDPDFSFRNGDVFREVRGLEPGSGEPAGARLLEEDFRNMGGCGIVVEVVGFSVGVVRRGAGVELAVVVVAATLEVVVEGSADSACPLSDWIPGGESLPAMTKWRLNYCVGLSVIPAAPEAVRCDCLCCNRRKLQKTITAVNANPIGGLHTGADCLVVYSSALTSLLAADG